VCFSPEKHPTFKRKYESSSPIKLTKFQLKKNEKTSEQELLINNRTKLQDPSDKESEFDYRPINTEVKQTKDTTAEDIMDGKPNTYVNICGRITFTGEQKPLISTVNPSKCKKLCSLTTLGRFALYYGKMIYIR